MHGLHNPSPTPLLSRRFCLLSFLTFSIYLLFNPFLPQRLYPPPLALSPCAVSPRTLHDIHIISALRSLPKGHILPLLFLLVPSPLLPRTRIAASPADAYVDTRWDGKAERLSNLGKIQRIDVIYFLERIRGVCLEIRPESVPCRLMQEVVLL